MGATRFWSNGPPSSTEFGPKIEKKEGSLSQARKSSYFFVNSMIASVSARAFTNRARLSSVCFPPEIVERFTPEWVSAERYRWKGRTDVNLEKLIWLKEDTESLAAITSESL